MSVVNVDENRQRHTSRTNRGAITNSEAAHEIASIYILIMSKYMKLHRKGSSSDSVRHGTGSSSSSSSIMFCFEV